MEGESRTELVYGESNGGLTFLEKQYALDIGGFREALGEASTWGELKARVSEERYKEAVDAWVANQLDRLTDEGGAEDDEPGVTPPDPDNAFLETLPRGWGHGSRFPTKEVEPARIEQYARNQR